VIIISWNAFQNWQNWPGGFWALLGEAILGVSTVVGVVIAVLGYFKKDEKLHINGNVSTQGGSFIARDQINYYVQLHPDTMQETLHQQIGAYLKWAQEAFRDVILSGIERQNTQVIQLPLDSIYVPLDAEYLDNTQGVEQTQPSSKMIQMSELFGLGQRLIITGGPGSGKSTVLQHIAWVLAEAICTDKCEMAEQKLGLTGALPIPIYVPINLYAVYLRNLPKDAKAEESTLATYITQYLINRQAGLSFDPGFLAYLIQQQDPVLLLLDGLDEIPEIELRKQVSQKIDDLVSGRSNLRVIVTSRTTAYYGDVMLKRDFRQVRVQPLTDEQINRLIHLAYRAIWFQSPDTAAKRANELLEGIANLESSRRQRFGNEFEPLVTTPLMVRMLLMVHIIERRELPNQRAELYQKVVEALLRPDYSPDRDADNEVGHSISGSLAINLEMFQYIAFHMHSLGAQQGKTISEEDLKDTLAREETFQPFIKNLIDQTCERCTLLKESGGQYQFIHFSFQEFLAARYLASTYKSEGAADFLLEGPVLENWWREPALLLVGYLDATAPSEARRLLIRLITDAPTQLEDNVRIAAAELAAAAYLECQQQASDLKEKIQSRLELIFDPQNDTHPPIRCQAGSTLGRLGDPRFKSDSWQLPNDTLLGFVYIPKGELTTGDAGAEFTVNIPEFYIAKFPVTNAQYQCFIDAKGYENEEYWLEAIAHGIWTRGKVTGFHDKQKPRNRPRNYDPRFSVSNHPVVGITWYEALAYSRWITEALSRWTDTPADIQRLLHTQWSITLPSEIEWEWAARGSSKEKFPWEGIFDPNKANTLESGVNGTSAVGCFPCGKNDLGLFDMSGNIWEWTRSMDESYPYPPPGPSRQRREMLMTEAIAARILRGGSWFGSQKEARLTSRGVNNQNFEWSSTGFRLAISMSQVTVEEQIST